MSDVLVLCHGNINRSPTAAAVLRHWWPNLSVRSAGFVNPGRRAAKKMREAVARHGYDLSDHRSQLVTRAMVREAKWVVLMDGGNRRRFREQFLDYDHKVIMLGNYAPTPTKRIPDPAYMNKDSDEFSNVVQLIIDCARTLGGHL